MNIQAYFEKALECQKTEQVDLAITLYREILDKDPAHLPSLYNLAYLYGEQGNYAQALIYYDKLIALEPDFVRAYYNGAICELQLKNPARAQVLLEEALRLVPEYGAAQHMLGLILFKQGRWLEAKQHLRQALDHDSENAELLNHLGMACLHVGQLDEAQKYLSHSIAIMPYLAEAQYHLGVIHLKRGHYETAQQYFEGTVDRDSQHFGAWYNLGLLNKQKGFLKIADECLAKAQALQPDSQYVAFLRAAINQETTPEHPPEGFVKDLFDRYAGYYEAQMREGIDYQVPLQLHSLFVETVVTAPHSLVVVDLGCGTGLAGSLFRAEAKQLRGVDLSSYMLEKAEEKHLYDDLQLMEVHEALKLYEPNSVDLFIAADVLGYIGVLDELFELVTRALKPSGYWVFSIELGAQDLALSERIRFTHNPHYIHQLCEKFNLTVLSETETVLRKHEVDEIKGCLFLTQKINRI